MKALDVIMQEGAFHRELSYTKKVALTLQPHSYADFDKHPEFAEAFERWTQNDRYRGLDFVRIWGMVLNVKQAFGRGNGSVAEVGVYQGQSAALLALYADFPNNSSKQIWAKVRRRLLKIVVWRRRGR